MDRIEHKKGKIYYSMGEVTEMFDVNPSLIRFWESKFDILRPHKNKKGNRLFTPQDVDNLKLIYHLVKEKGMTLAGAQKRLKQNKDGTVREQEVIDRLQKIRAMLAEIREELRDDPEGYVTIPVRNEVAEQENALEVMGAAVGRSVCEPEPGAVVPKKSSRKSAAAIPVPKEVAEAECAEDESMTQAMASVAFEQESERAASENEALRELGTTGEETAAGGDSEMAVPPFEVQFLAFDPSPETAETLFAVGQDDPVPDGESAETVLTALISNCPEEEPEGMPSAEPESQTEENRPRIVEQTLF